MSELFKYSLILLSSVFISALSQILLKKSANKTYKSKIKEYLNPMVILAYSIFLGTTFISMYALKVVPLSMSPILEATGYIFIPILSFIFLKEKMNKRQLLAIFFIIVGIVVYSIKI